MVNFLLGGERLPSGVRVAGYGNRAASLSAASGPGSPFSADEVER